MLIEMSVIIPKFLCCYHVKAKANIFIMLMTISRTRVLTDPISLESSFSRLFKTLKIPNILKSLENDYRCGKVWNEPWKLRCRLGK